MRTILPILLLVCLAACGAEKPAGVDPLAGYAVYGEAFQPEDAVPVEAVLAERAHYAGRAVKVEGRVAEVCRAAGCWLTLQAEGENIRIHVPRDEAGAYVFTVPTDLSGKRVVVYGELAAHEVTKAMHDHYEEDAGHAPQEGEEHDAGAAPHTELQMIARGVLVEKEAAASDA
ncbi:DUF4920 domain-containing protein [Rhodocaloribacter litoris]|uniref:DUF4920 domain-containing protein n=1 Tax=Rhodocaloribacter litoris TaxID=2558931 RepID=UPI00141FCBDE|nr:DUF4920 domain-containing protein [Rhodocaloribacter litoris]QXD15600.1 DUF4920 domain-containing protein [Rhodocaloribacter litoris]